MQLIRASASRPKTTLIRASALVPIGLESFEEGGTKNLRAYSLVSLLEQREKNGLIPAIWDSLTKPNFGNHSIQPWTQEVEARLVNLHWDAILSRDSVIA